MKSLMPRSLMLVIALAALTGCASFGKKLKAFLGGKSESSTTQAQKAGPVKYSDTPNMYSGARRQYKRVTRESLQNEAALEPQAGSLWVMEGQGAFLFAQNIVRMIGDPIAVTIEGEPKEQLQAKVDIIRKLWAKYEERQTRMRALASSEGEEKDKGKDEKGKDGKGEAKAKPDAAKEQAAQAPTENPGLGVRLIPARIVERTADGNYRIKGSQPFMIGTREYKMIVTGIVRSEDFNDEGIGASKLLDAKYDVVSVRRKEQEL